MAFIVAHLTPIANRTILSLLQKDDFMHLPDHYLNPAVCIATGAAAAGGLAWAAANLRGARLFDVRAAGVTAAAIFAAQMVNFPVASGTSGHVVGGSLAAILLGPAAAMIVMTIVLAVQCLLFADGGVAALGANVLNMAVIAPLVGWAVYRAICGKHSSLSRQMLGGAAAAWVSVAASAAACATELGVSGVHPLGDTLAAMVSVHAPIGFGEAIATATAIALAAAEKRLVAAAVLGLVALAPLASTLPDGLEAVAARLGFTASGAGLDWPAPLPDYTITGIQWPALATAIAALLGVALCGATAWTGSAYLRNIVYLRKRGSSASPRESK